MMDQLFLLELSYLLGSISFIVGLKMLSHPETARRGNIIAGVGMLLAIVATMVFHQKDGQHIGNIPWIIAGMGVGTIIGWLMAMKVKMTAMPQMVSFFNGMGGACAAIISLVEYNGHGAHDPGFVIMIYLGLVIGSVSFSGSMIAFAKLDGRIRDIFTSVFTYINLTLLIVILGLIIWGVSNPDVLGGNLIWLLLGISLLYGVLFVMPIGGADMPVVISLLNSFTGVAAAMGGFLYDNTVMLTGGILVGSAGTILTLLMTKAMNRSLRNVIIGSFGGGVHGPGAQGGDKNARETTPTDAAIMVGYAGKVCIVPGYGLAVAQAQHACHELEKALEEKGVEVYYAVHPVAGRMPGHMNVLLAEADVPYEKLLELEEANALMSTTDVAIIVGANDVVNPLAETDNSSPIYGMPIIRVWDAKHVIVIKRSLSPGYAKIDNPLFYMDKNRMFFSDAKKALNQLIAEVRGL